MKNIEEIIKNNAELIEASLDSLLPNEEEPHSVIYEAMRYSAMEGGKRIRPLLTLEFCRLFGGDVVCAIPYACAVECVHTYSLIHDDLPCMDDDDERRGKPSSHKVYGEANALLAGDALLTYAFSLIADNPFIDADRNCRAVSILSLLAGHDGMIGGQICDMLYENRDVSFEELVEMQRKKTGDLFAAAAVLGVIAADKDKTLDDSVYEAVRAYANEIGLAFQIIDDILDTDEGGSDAEAGKTTVLSFMSKEEARSFVITLTQWAIEEISKYDGSEVLTDLAVWLSERCS